MKPRRKDYSPYEGLRPEIMEVIDRVALPLRGIEDNHSGTPLALTRLQMVLTARSYAHYGLNPIQIAEKLNEIFKGLLRPIQEGNIRNPERR